MRKNKVRIFYVVLCCFLLAVAPSVFAQEEATAPAGMQANPPEVVEAADEAPETEEVAPTSDEATADGEVSADPRIDELNQLLDESESAEEETGADSTSASDRSGPIDPTESFMDVAKWLLILVAGFLVLAYLFRGVGRRAKILPAANLAEVLGRVYLTSNTSVHFVRTGDRVLAVGVAPNHIALLTEFSPDEFESSADTGATLPSSSKVAKFMDELQQQRGKLDASTPSGVDLPTPDDDEIDSLRTDIARLRGMLREDPRNDAGR